MDKLLAFLGSKPILGAALTAGLKLAAALILLLAGTWLCRQVANFLRRALTRAHVDVTLVTFLRNLLYGILMVLLLVAVLQMLGVPSASLVAAVGGAVLAIGLALQGSLSNLAWGVLLIIFRPFRVGDTVEAGGQTGTVQSVSLMYTTLVTADNRVAAIPNSKIGSDAIINVNALGRRRAEIKLRLPYSTDLDRAMEEIRRVCFADARVLSDPAPAVYVIGLDEGNVELSVRAWATTGDYWAVLTDLTRTIQQQLEQAGMGLAPPRHEVLVRQQESGA